MAQFLRIPEIPPAFGGLDSDAFQSGRAVGAHLLRELARNGNSLACKAQHLVSMAWPHTYQIAGDDYHGLHLPVPASWSLITAPVPVLKMPGHHTAAIHLRAFVSGSSTVLVQVCSKDQPYRSNASAGDSNVIACTGDGDDDVDYYGDGGVRLDVGPAEELSIYVKAGVDYAGASGASPQSTSAATDPGTLFEYSLNCNDATWDANLASRAVSVVLYTSQGDLLTTRDVVSVWPSNGSGSTLRWSEPLSATELNIMADASANPPPGGDWWFLGLRPTFGLVGFHAHTTGRSS